MTSTTIDPLCTSATIRKSLADKTYSATFNFDKTTVGGITSPIFWTKLVFKIPDYTGTQQTIFVGIAPSGNSNYTGAGAVYTGNQSLKAYDHSYYLGIQYLDVLDYSLLKYVDQIAVTTILFEMTYQDVIYAFTVGDRILGHTSGAQGSITSISGYTVRMTGVLKSTTDPLNPGSYIAFTDGEELWVAGTKFARAYGIAHSVDPPSRIYPDLYITKLLGGGTYYTPGTLGGNWPVVTGLYPYRMQAVDNWGTPGVMAENGWYFNESTTKMDAINQICQYCKCIFYVGFHDVTIGGVLTYDVPCAYFVNEANIDTAGIGLDLPAMIYVTAPDLYLVSPITLTQAGENQYNWFVVRCQSLTGQWYETNSATAPGLPMPDVYDPIYNPTGTGIKRTYSENNKNICTKADCNARILDLYNYYRTQISTWRATFRLRSDLRLLQKLYISGYGNAIPNSSSVGAYRIIGIEYNYDQGGTKNEVTVEIIQDSNFRAYLNLHRVFMNSIFEVQNIVQDMLNRVANHTGIVVSVDGTKPSQTIMVVINGSGGAQYRVNDPSGSIVVGNEVIITVDTSNGLLMASKIA